MAVYASFEDFIYIVLGLAWVIYSAYNAKKKQKAKNKPTSTSEKKSILDSLINEIGLNDEKEEANISSSPKDVHYNEDDINPEIIPSDEPQRLFSYDDEYEENNFSTPVYIIENEPIITSDKVDTNHITSKNESLVKKKTTKKRIDLRKAVIYSEILKKVYF